jgi:hypothetical protein
MPDRNRTTSIIHYQEHRWDSFLSGINKCSQKTTINKNIPRPQGNYKPPPKRDSKKKGKL